MKPRTSSNPEDSVMKSGKVSFEAAVGLSFEDAVLRCREALTAEGFGVITEIDVQATMKKKLGVDVPSYLILGACHAPSAHRALTVTPEVGVLLPCNVTVSVEDGATVVRAMNPVAVLGLVAEPSLADVGVYVANALKRVVAACE
jgi:uncharacterized protein (DUF302 family)